MELTTFWKLSLQLNTNFIGLATKKYQSHVPDQFLSTFNAVGWKSHKPECFENIQVFQGISHGPHSIRCLVTMFCLALKCSACKCMMSGHITFLRHVLYLLFLKPFWLPKSGWLFLKKFTSVQCISHGHDCFLTMLTCENACPLDIAALRLNKNPMGLAAFWSHLMRLNAKPMGLNTFPLAEQGLLMAFLNIDCSIGLTAWLNIDHSWPQIWWAWPLFQIFPRSWTLSLWAWH